MNQSAYFTVAMLAIILIVFAYAHLSRGRKNKRLALDTVSDGSGNDALRNYLKFRCKPAYIDRRLVRTLEDPPGVLCPAPADTIDERVEGPEGPRVKVTKINGWRVSTYVLSSQDVFETLVYNEDTVEQFQHTTPDRLVALQVHADMVLKVKSKLYQEIMV